MGGIGGLAYIVSSVSSWNFEVGVAGMGFLALAVMIFGQWKPFHIAGAALIFAVFKALANIADSSFLAFLHWPKEVYNMMPFIASMVILSFTSKNSALPRPKVFPTTRAQDNLSQTQQMSILLRPFSRFDFCEKLCYHRL